MDKFKTIDFEDVKDITAEAYFSKESFAADMFNAKYSLEKLDGGKETPAEVFWRIASGLAEMETSKKNKLKYKKIWFSLLWEGWWRPGGSIMSGVGSSERVSLNNCTYLPIEGDSLEQLSDCRKNLMKCAAFRQGLGIVGNPLRPRGSLVNNSAKYSTGAVPWLDDLVAIGKKVGQMGRLPALLAALGVHHPDIEEFISCKDDLEFMNNANLSVQITDAFMEAVEKDEEWELRFDVKASGEEIVKTINARKLFTMIAEHAKKSAEPGVQYIDSMKKGSMVQCIFNATGDTTYEIEGSNAPVIGNSLVHTSKGLETIEHLYEVSEAEVLIDDRHYHELGVVKPERTKFKKATFKKYVNQPVYNIVLSNKKVLQCNDKHEWLTDRGYLATTLIKKGDKLFKPSDSVWTTDLSVEDKNTQDYNDGLLLGWFVGDGFYSNVVDTNKPKKDGKCINRDRKAIGFIWNKNDPKVFELFKNKYLELTGKKFNYIRDRGSCFETRSLSKEIYAWFLSFGFDGVNKYKVPKKCFTNRLLAAGFIASLFGADGYVSDPSIGTEKSFRLTTVSESLAKEVQSLASAFGVSVSIKISKQKPVVYTTVDGTKKLSKCKPYRFDLSFGNYKSRQRFYKRIGIYHAEKEARLKFYLDKGLKKYPTLNYVVVKSVEFTETYADMYCAQVPNIRGLIIEGVLSSNCSEKPLPKYGVCNLASINMEMFSTDEKEYKKELENIIPYLVRLSDNVVTYELKNELSPVEKQAYMVKQLREIGMGITNLHGWLLKQNIAYDSDEAIDRVEKFFKHYAYIVFKTSIELGKEKGNAPGFELVKDKNEFMNSIYFKNIVNEFFNGDATNVTHMRNMAHMSIAPTGSLSNSFPYPCISSGVEPVIGLYYWRKTRAVNIDASYTYYFVIPNRLKDFILSKMDKNTDDYTQLSEFSGSLQDDNGKIGENLIEIISKYVEEGFFKPAHEINYLKKIKLISGLYNWLDSAISCTYNLSQFATTKDIETIYMESYKQGCRAVSVYVDGCRSGILIFESPVADRNRAMAKDFLCAERPDRILLNCAPKRPKEIECNIHQVSIKGEVWTVLVGLLNGLPFEIFCGQAEELYIPKNCKQGKIIKQGKSKYSLEVMIRKSMIEYKNLAYVLMTNNERALTRLLSLNLRHGIPLQFIVDQLKKSSGDITAFATAISRVLSIYIKEIDYLYKKGEKTCPMCGKETMIFRGGCMECIECKHSKCG